MRLNPADHAPETPPRAAALSPHCAGKQRLTSRKGLTFLEVVLAMAMLAMVAAVILGAINSIVSGQQRSLKRLGAAELANRLMLQYLDDDESLPSSSLPIDYGADRYRWSMSTSPITLTPAKEPTSRAPRQATGFGAERLKSVTFRVWLADPSGEEQAAPGAPGFVITRIVDPIFGPIRNPDSRQRLLEDPVAYRKFLEQFVGATGINAPASDTRGRPTTPKPGSTGK